MLASSLLARWAPLPLRLIVGYGFIVHGYAKVSRGPETFAAVLHTIGVPLPHLLAWLTTLVELVGGFAILAGGSGPLSVDAWRRGLRRPVGDAVRPARP